VLIGQSTAVVAGNKQVCPCRRPLDRSADRVSIGTRLHHSLWKKKSRSTRKITKSILSSLGGRGGGTYVVTSRRTRCRFITEPRAFDLGLVIVTAILEKSACSFSILLSLLRSVSGPARRPRWRRWCLPSWSTSTPGYSSPRWTRARLPTTRSTCRRRWTSGRSTGSLGRAGERNLIQWGGRGYRMGGRGRPGNRTHGDNGEGCTLRRVWLLPFRCSWRSFGRMALRAPLSCRARPLQGPSTYLWARPPSTSSGQGPPVPLSGQGPPYLFLGKALKYLFLGKALPYLFLGKALPYLFWLSICARQASAAAVSPPSENTQKEHAPHPLLPDIGTIRVRRKNGWSLRLQTKKCAWNQRRPLFPHESRRGR